MSGGAVCRCAECREPIKAPTGANRPGRLWRVYQRRCNHSYFSRGRYAPSVYSAVRCLRCGAHWRTRGSYVDVLPDLVWKTEFNISPGVEGYEAAMERLGRLPWARREGE